MNPAATPERLSDDEISRVSAGGLGALYHHLHKIGQISCSGAAAGILESAELTSRVLGAKSRRSALAVLDLLQDNGLNPVVLKGMDVANRFYPQHHWRVMGDLDLLLSKEGCAKAITCLKDAGFTNPTSDPDTKWDDHHHVVPLYSDTLNVWVEMHHKLVTYQSPFSNEPALLTDAIYSDPVSGSLEDRDVLFLAPERALLLAILHWYFDLVDRWSSAGLQRAAVDCFFMRCADIELSDGLGLSAQACRAIQIMEKIISTMGVEIGSKNQQELPRFSAVERAISQLVNFSVEVSDFNKEVTGDMFRRALNARSDSGLKLATTIGAVKPLVNAIRQRL